ncbi:MAG TPA: MarR family winged helix-turn-helix transcriptional regulator [Hyphomonadaceae bacterium]|nr:MarR family winged helix-turn-helix transcriptional regulator [Hyphomonadaceae bacterium]
MADDIDDTVSASSRQLSMGVVETLIGFRFRRIQNEMSRRFKMLIARAEVNPGMFSALALIRANPGLSQTELAAQIGMDRATVVALIDALEANGWAKRTRDAQDRRKHSLSISPAGSRELARLEELALANEAPVRAALGPKGLADLRRLLDRIDAALAEAGEPQKRTSKK